MCHQEDMVTRIIRRRWNWLGHVHKRGPDSIIKAALLDTKGKTEGKKTQTHFATDRGSRNKRTKKRFGQTLEASWPVTDKDGELSLWPFSPKVSRAVIKKVTIDAEASLLGSCFGLVAMLRVLKTKKYSADAICNVKVF